MNSKIKNYVDVLFNDIPDTRKAKELKEEILSNLNEHFEEHIREGKSENQAYTEAISDIGDIDEVLKSITPDKDLYSKINEYKNKKARFTSIGVSLYILGVVFLLGLSGISAVTSLFSVELMGIVGLLLLLTCSAVATGMIIYINMSIPQDIEPYITRHKNHYDANIDTSNKSGRFVSSLLKIFWQIVVIAYLLISFTTNAWNITWIIFLIGGAIRQAIIMFFDAANSKDEKNA